MPLPVRPCGGCACGARIAVSLPCLVRQQVCSTLVRSPLSFFVASLPSFFPSAFLQNESRSSPCRLSCQRHLAATPAHLSIPSTSPTPSPSPYYATYPATPNSSSFHSASCIFHSSAASLPLSSSLPVQLSVSKSSIRPSPACLPTSGLAFFLLPSILPVESPSSRNRCPSPSS